MNGLRRTSVENAAHAAEEAHIQQQMQEARQNKLVLRMILQHLDKMARSKIWWLNRFGSGKGARPAHEIETHRGHLEALVQARDLLKNGSGDATERGG